ncbi:MAG: PASTA domain-containing protein [bacterium]
MARAQTLADLLDAETVLTEPELARLFCSILEDLDQAHAQGRLHGDIKPRKIVQIEDGVWRLIDYGVSRVGTARYISPEKAQRMQVDARSDLYSLGVVLYEAATGRPPFDAELGAELIQAHIHQAPPLPSSIRPGISKDLDGIILKALAKRPEERFQNAGQFRGALAALIPKEEERKPRVLPPRGEAVKKPRVKAEFNGSLAGEVSFQEVPTVQETQKPAQKVEAQVMAGARPVTERAQVTPPALKEEYKPKGAPAKEVPKAGAGVELKRVGEVSRVRRLAWIGVLIGVTGLGMVVFLISSRGRIVPDVLGLSEVEAELMLKRAGLKMEIAGEKDDTTMAGRVAQQLPGGGAKIKRGGRVEVWLSSGMVALPNVRGHKKEDAQKELRSIGIDSVVVSYEYSDEVEAGTVLGQEPRSETRVRPRTTVRLRVAGGRATCPQCGARREPGAQFCTRCGFRFSE